MGGQALAQRLVAATNRGDASGYAAEYTADAVLRDPLLPTVAEGRDAVERAMAALLRAFPDLQWRLRSVVEDDGRVALEAAVTATNDGPLETPDGDLAPTGRPVAFELGMFLDLGPDGRISRARAYCDATGVMAQLGLVT